MFIQKYKAKIADTNRVVVGYITEIREYLGNGSYGKGTSCLMSVTEKSMINSHYGNFIVKKESVELFNECPICGINEQNKEFNFLACSLKCYNKL